MGDPERLWCPGGPFKVLISFDPLIKAVYLHLPLAISSDSSPLCPTWTLNPRPIEPHWVPCTFPSVWDGQPAFLISSTLLHFWPSTYGKVRACSVAQSHLSLCDPKDCSQAPRSMGFSRQEYLKESGLPFSSPGDLPDPKINPVSPTAPPLQANSLLLSHRGHPIW